MRLSSLRADCHEYMNINIDAILWSVNNLFDCKNGIISERTAMKMTTIYCQINGPEHNNSKRAKELLEKCKKRYIMVVLDGVCKRCQADQKLHDNVEYLVIIGPITNPRNIANERTVQIRQDQVTLTPCEGCPVICHGLVSQPHLNGEL